MTTANRATGAKVGRYARLPGTLWRATEWDGVSLEAVGLWALLVSYAAEQQTDGRVPERVVRMCGRGAAVDAALDELAEIGAVSIEADGAVLVSWSGQLTRLEWEQRAEATRRRVARHRVRRGREDASPEPRVPSLRVSESQERNAARNGSSNALHAAGDVDPADRLDDTLGWDECFDDLEDA